MAIGVFDSGIGGLSIHRALANHLPTVDLLYFADQANCPYGGLDGEHIVELTRRGCTKLFDAGANLVILGCNTACAIALRRLQQTWLPHYRKHLGRAVNVIGIIVPTIEAATGLPWEHDAERRGDQLKQLDVIGVFATTATAASRVYEIEIDKRRQDVAVFAEPCTDIARLIEAGADRDLLSQLISKHARQLEARIGRAPDRAILGCTHYEIVADLFEDAIGPSTTVIHQPSAVTDATLSYIQRHPEYELGHKGLRRFLTTGTSIAQNDHAVGFWGAPIAFEIAA